MERWKISLKSLYLAAALALIANAAEAVTFSVNDANSFVLLTKKGGVGDPISASLAAGLAGTTFDLDSPGEFNTFDFLVFDVVQDFGAAIYDISATLAFDAPLVSVTAGGTGGALVLFGNITAGILTWNSGVPVQVDIGGGGLATIDFQEGVALFPGKSVRTSATATLDVAPVPLPASALLLLAGLIGLAALRRQKS